MLILHLVKLQIVLFLIEGLLTSMLLLHAGWVRGHFIIDLSLGLLCLFAVLQPFSEGYARLGHDLGIVLIIFFILGWNHLGANEVAPVESGIGDSLVCADLVT